MRTIKFRAWYPGECFQDGTPRMMQGVCISSKGKVMELEGGWDYRGDDEKAIPMQFTGLKDKNGKDVYEGDIVRTTACLVNDCERPGGIGVGEVRAYEDGYYIFSENEKDRLYHYCRAVFSGEYARQNKLEVIGDVYTHPELLATPQPNKGGE